MGVAFKKPDGLEEYFDLVADKLGYPRFHRYFKSDTILVDDNVLHLDILDIDKDAPTVVFLPGTAIYALCYAEILYLVSKAGYNVVGFDPRGHGQSDGLRGDYTVSEIMTDTEAVIDYARRRFNSKVTLMGSSQGGIISLYMAAQEAKVDSVICQNFADLMHPDTLELTRHPRIFRYVRSMMGKAGGIIGNAQVPIATYLELEKIPVTGFGNIKNFIEKDPLALKSISIRALHSLGNTELAKSLEDIKTPVFVFQGDADSIFSVDYTKKIYNQLQCKKRLIVYPDMSHSLMSENAQEIVPDIIAWLDEIYKK